MRPTRIVPAQSPIPVPTLVAGLSRVPVLMLVAATAAAILLARPALAEGGETSTRTAEVSASEINARLHAQLASSPSRARIESVSGQMYLSQENIDAGVVRDALTALLEAQSGSAESVAVQRPPRLNFEIHFAKNSADITPESKVSLDELAQVLRDDFSQLRFLLGGHTDQDGEPDVNGPLSQARAESARSYLIEAHGIDPGRLVARGFGSGEPLRAVEASPQDKLYNRRVDLRPLR